MAGIGGEGGVVEDLILAIEAMGVPEATAAIDELTASVDALAVATDRADVAASGGAGGAAAGKGKGLMGTLTSFKTLLAGIGVYEAVKSFSNFQSTMERLRTQTGATQSEVAKMSKGIEHMAVATGTGPQSLAEAMYHIESAGFRGKTALDALRVSAEGAKIGNADLTDTTTAMTAVMVAGFRGVHTLRQAMGELNATVGAGDMTMQNLNEALGTGILATMKILGLQVRDTGAALAVLGDNNIRGAQAATRLRMGLMTLIKPSSVAETALRKLGLAPLQLAEDLRKPDGLLVMLKDLERHLKGLTPTEQAHSLAAIFGGGRNSAAMLTLITQMGRLEEKYRAVSKGGKEFNADWQATTHTLKFFGDQVKALVDVALIKLGSGIAWVLERIKGFVDAFNKGRMWAILLMGAVSGLALMLTALLIPAIIGGTGAVIAFTLALATNPVVWVAVAIGMLIMLIVKVKAVRQAFVDAFHWVVNAATAAFDWFKSHWKLLAVILLGPWGLLLDFVVTNFHAIVGVAKWLIGAIKTVFGPVVSFLIAPWKSMFAFIKEVVVAIVHAVAWMVEQVGHLIGKILGPIKSVGSFLGHIVGGPLSAVGSIFGLAEGGTTRSAGPYMVGERGPELVYLPSNSYVQPNHELGRPAGGGNPLVLEVPVYLDRRQVSRQVIRTGLEAQSCR